MTTQSMDSSKIISLDDFIRKENRYPGEEEAIVWGLQLCGLVKGKGGQFPLLTPRNIYVENGNNWSTANPPVSSDAAEALFRLGAVYHYLLTRDPFRISHYLDGPPSVRERNPQISVRLESIVLKLVQNVKSLRYGSVEELTKDLERLQKELTGEWKIHWGCFKGNELRVNAMSSKGFQPDGKTLKEAWNAPIGEIWASPVAAGEYVFVGSGDGHFYSMDAASGKILWKVYLGGRIESTACVSGSQAFVGSDMGTLFAFNIKNGSILWKRPLGEYVRSSPICDDKNVYVGSISPTQKTGLLWCLSRDKGSIVWKKAVAPIFSSPLMDQNRLVVGSDDERLYCFGTDGKEKWRLALDGKIRGTCAGSRNFLFVGCFGGVLYRIRATTGEIVWKKKDVGPMYSSPAYGRSFIAVGNNSGSIQYFQSGTGKKKAEFLTGGPVTASPLIVQRSVLVGSNDGIFYILDAKGKPICTFDAKSPINSSACYSHHKIYVGSDRGLLALAF